MNRDEVPSLLRAHKATLARRFGVVELRLYGSFVRDQAAGHSDVDVLVRFDAPPDWKRYLNLIRLGGLVTRGGIESPTRGFSVRCKNNLSG